MGKADADKRSLAETLKEEERACPQCGFRIENPFVEICPRCTGILPRIQVNCEGCVHRILCPIGKNRKFTP